MRHDKTGRFHRLGSRMRADGARSFMACALCVVALSCATAVRTAAGVATTTGDTLRIAPEGQAARPRIGLALSGGAARGLAHVGVLKVLDELRIPIDLVAGTSMGSIVGGLFALGEAPAEIEAAIRNIDWSDLFSDRPDRTERSFRRKEDDRSDFLDFEFGIENGKLKLPRSLVAGQKLAFAFESPTLHTAGLDGFDSLAVPFRAVATDLRSGKMVVFERGSLVRALRASMSVPGFFSPVEADGRLLIDGGVVRNLPIDVVRDMGADVVIAVDVSEELGARSREDLASLLGLSLQLTTLVVKINTDPVLPLANVVLRPALGDLSIIDFESADQAIRVGEQAVREAAEALREYALSKEDYAAFLAGRRRVPNVQVIVDSIELDNRSHIDDRAILKRLSMRAGDTLELTRLRRDLVDIYDLGSLELVDFALRKPSAENHSGAAATTSGTAQDAAQPGMTAPQREPRTLRLVLNEKTYAPNLLRIGLSLSSELRGRTRFQALGRLTRVEMNRWGAEWRSDFLLGSTNGVLTEWYQPLEFRRRWFVALDASYDNSFQDLYKGDERAAEYEIREALGRFDVGMQLARSGEFRTGLFTGWVKTTLRAGVGFPVEEGGQGGWRARFAVDRLDDGDFPRRGQSGSAEIELSRRALGSAQRYDRLQANVNHLSTWGENTFFIAADGGSSLGTDLPPQEEFLLGGFASLSGLRQEERRGNVFATARLGYFRTILRDFDIFGADLYGGAWFEAGNIWPHNSAVRFEDLLYTGTLALGGDTILGPVYLAYGRTHEGADSIFLTVGSQVAPD
jgi:NTE family protein